MSDERITPDDLEEIREHLDLEALSAAAVAQGFRQLLGDLARSLSAEAEIRNRCQIAELKLEQQAQSLEAFREVRRAAASFRSAQPWGGPSWRKAQDELGIALKACTEGEAQP